MANGFGFSFAPGGISEVGMEGQDQSRPQGLQEPVRLLSMRLPKREAQGQTVPSALLNSPGGGGLQGQGLGGLDQVLQQLMRAFASQSAPGMAQAGPQAPVPSHQGPMPIHPPQNISGGATQPPPSFGGYVDPPPQEPVPGLFEETPQNAWTIPGRNPILAGKYEDDPLNNYLWNTVRPDVGYYLGNAQPTPQPPRFIVDNNKGGGGNNA
jgi:hypothetical protein